MEPGDWQAGHLSSSNRLRIESKRDGQLVGWGTPLANVEELVH